MTQRSLPWDGTTLEDAGPYGADDWQQFQQQILNDQDPASDRGPIWTDFQDSLVVTEHATPDMNVDIGPGAALVDGSAYWNDDTENPAIQAADPTLNRIDRVILRLDATLGKVRLAVKTGTPGASPTPPTLQKDRSPYFEVPLYQVYVGAAVTQIFNSNLTDERQFVNWCDSQVITWNDQSGSISVSSADTWEDIDATNLIITLVTRGGPVEVWGAIPFQHTGGSNLAVHLDFTYDGNRYNDAVHSSSFGLAYMSAPTGAFRHLHFGPVRVNLAAGIHVFKLQWKEQSDNSLYLYGTAIFGAREING